MNALQISLLVGAAAVAVVELSPSVPTDSGWVKTALLLVILLLLLAADKAGA
jgi:hypothetical protein